MANNKKLAGAVMSHEQQILEKTRMITQMRLDGANEDEVFEKAQAKDLFQYLTERIVPMDLASSGSPVFHQGGDVVTAARKELWV